VRDRVWPVLALAACLLAGCTGRRQGPRRAGSLKTAVRPVRIADAGPEGMTLLFDVEFDNGSSAALTVARIDYELSLATRPWTEHEPWAKGTAGQGTAVEPRRTTVVSIRVPVPTDRLRKVLPLTAQDPQLGYVIRAAVHLGAGGDKTVRVPLRGQSIIGIPLAPVVALTRLTVAKLEQDAARLDLTVRITNRNAFRLTIEQLEGRVELAGTRTAPFGLAPRRTLAPGGSIDITVPIDVDLRGAGDVRSGIERGRISVRLTGSARVATPYGSPRFPIDRSAPLRVRR